MEMTLEMDGMVVQVAIEEQSNGARGVCLRVLFFWFCCLPTLYVDAGKP